MYMVSPKLESKLQVQYHMYTPWYETITKASTNFSIKSLQIDKTMNLSETQTSTYYNCLTNS